MAELHRFKDDLQNKKTQVSTSKLDENFRTVRLRLGRDCENVFVLVQSKGIADTLNISPPSQNGTFVIGCQNGVLVWLETEDCE